MESKKFNWNRLLSCLIAGVGFVLLCLFIGICFVTPIANVSVKALTKQDIENSNIYFVSAKTKIKKATNYERVQKKDRDGNYFYTYEYDYTQDVNTTPLYYTTEKNKTLDSYSSTLSNVYLTSDGKEIALLEDYSYERANDFIPSGITSFKNSITDSIEDVFYDEIDDSDFVLLNNYTSHTKNNGSTFNVENFYLSFGTSYANERDTAHTTPLYALRVQGMLYSNNQTHYLQLDNPINSTLPETSQSSYYWYQYFDLNNLKAYKTAEGNIVEGENNTYDIQDQQGKYVFTFYFMRYKQSNGAWEVEDEQEQVFTYTFYLLDSANYDAIPTINNATLGAMENDKINEYFYNFTNDTPYLTYDPESFNISFTRENKEISENITSSYSIGTYELNGKKYPKGIITYYSNGSVKKQVYILVNYNTNKTLVEYLYLSTNSQNTLTISTYSDALNLLNNDTLKFEYKVTQKLTISENSTNTKYTTNTYYTYDYNKLEFCTDENPNNYDSTNPSSEYIRVASDGTYYYSENGSSENEKNIVTITNATADLNMTNLKSEDGVILNKTDLTTAIDLDINSIKYVLTIDAGANTTSIVKSYKNSSEIDAPVLTTTYPLTTTTAGTYSFYDTIDTYLEIKYVVDNGGNVTNVKVVRHIYETSNPTANIKILNKLNNISSLDVDIKYNLKFEDLGIYTFDYKYNCIVCDDDLIKHSITNNNENSTNILKLNDFAQNFTKNEPTSSTYSTKDFTLNIWGYLDAQDEVTLNGTKFKYYPSNTKLEFNNGEDVTLILSENNKLSSNLGDKVFNATYSINTDKDGNSYLQISYELGNLKTTPSEITFTSKKLVNGNYVENREYVTNKEQKTAEEITLLYENINESSNTSIETNWANIIRLLEFLKTHNSFSTLAYSTTSPQISKDILHIYGSTAYFNKTNSETDSGYAKFSQVDSKLNTNYASDITKYIAKSSNVFYGTSLNASSIKNITDSGAEGLVNVAIKNGLKINDIIVTDVTPVFWKNLSTLLYSGKVSQSYIYRYPNYKITNDADNPISYGTCQTSLYTKDTYCQQDGLYEIVVLYKYDSFKSLDNTYTYDNTMFYQVFTFIIDNSSPKISIKVQDVDDLDNDEDITEYFTDLGLNKYTNKNIEISWNIPTYFQNDVYIDIERIAFDNTSSNNFKATYQQGTITTNSGSSTYVNNVTEFKKPQLQDQTYCVYITSDNGYACNGNYKVTLHYSSRGASTITQEFIIDKINIDGMQVLPAVQNNDGTYSINTYNQSYTASNQIINYDFTFRYNPKASNAKIYTYWYRIDLVASNDYDQVLNVNANETAITTTFNVNGKDSDSYSYGNQYIYNYGTDNQVLSSNYFTSNSSCIYLFKMVDEAGNECRYVVFYDTTTPRFKLDPTPNNSHNIVNDTTKLIFGDYKAIKIDTPNGYSINLGENLDNYTKLTANIDDKLKETLVYLNSSNNFNDTKIQVINGDYYMLLPIAEINIEDASTSTLNTPDSTKNVRYNENIPDAYYFFPTNPIITDAEDGNLYINTGSYESEVRTAIESYKFLQAKNSDLQLFDRFVETTNENIYGAIGKGEYFFQIYDKQRNKVEGYLWLTLDKTQTFAYGIFDTKTPDDPSKATAITGEEGTYALSKLYLSSLEANDTAKIPDYTLTYKFFELNDDLYEQLQNNYNISSVQILNKDSLDIPSNLTITDAQTYLQLVYQLKSDTNQYVTYYIELTNEDGKPSAKHSYPYDIQGIAGDPDSSGNPQNVYNTNKSSYSVSEDEDRTRVFTKMINPTPDATGKSDTVTQEGLYIFKRMYTDKSIDLGLDERIVYYVYYIDRTGIINVTTLNSISENLLSYQQDFGFVLGSDYTNQNLKKFINADSIENSQVIKDVTSSSSNTYNNVSNLFTTNKILVQFNLTADKYNFSAFRNKFYENIIGSIDSNLDEETKDSLTNSISTYLFNEYYYSYSLYKINLTLAKGQVNIINESETDSTMIYNTSAINNWLKGSYTTSGFRDNSFNLFLQDNNSNEYNVYLKDNSGYRQWENGAVTDRNANANRLDISFNIKHDAPTGDSYGKYYGRHDYDEDKTTSHSIPIEEYIGENGKVETRYALLSKYLQGGQLEPLSLSNKKVTIDSSDGQFVKLYSTNNESLIFTFEITQDDTKAQIDPNNIQIYKGTINDANLIFNRVNGINLDSTLVSASRMTSSYFSNDVNGITTYAIVVFDNNLDEILNDDETAYSYFRLLDSKDNPDQETYYIRINYVGDKSNYIKEDNNGNKISYFSTTYEVTIDRNKPTYNLTKLMDLDKYVYNTVSTTLDQTNYESVFNAYKPFYNFQVDEQYDVDRSDLENYFFALDYRQNTSFVFESISELDSNGGIYIRSINNTSYKFSKTPDDYKSYYEATYLAGNPQFSPSRAKSLSKNSNVKISDDPTTYYYITYGTFSNGPNDPNNNTIKVSDLMKFLDVGNYYEIIEQDEAGNYRVYAVYLPEYDKTKISYEYKINSKSDVTIGSTDCNANTIINISGIEFNIRSYQTTDYFAKANITISSSKLNETLSVVYSPSERCIYVKTSTNTIKDKFENISLSNFQGKFIEVINDIIKNYNDIVSSKTSDYYTQFGYVIKLNIIDRLGIQSTISNKLLDYEFTYNVAGSIIEPTFKNNASNFNMIIPAQQGTTYIEQVSAYKFQGGWSPKDPDDFSNSFSKTAEELKKGTTYTLNKGVYKFVITDNFKRTNTYFYEFGSSSTQAGGILSFSDKNVTYTDGYTYTSATANFVYDNSIYDIYIKFVGEVPSQDITYVDSDTTPRIVYSNNKSYSESDLSQYGIKVATIDNITTITFLGVTDLTKYHIKTIPASISSQYGYTWGQETTDTESKFLVYDKKLAIYTGIQDVIIRNSNGNILDTSNHLNLSEDFEVTTAWTNGYAPEKQIDFGSKIHLERTYSENNVIKTETLSNSNTYSITKPGDYTAYVYNTLNNRSEIISFTRGDSEIGIYSVYKVDNRKSTKLNPSARVTSENYETATENRTLIEFNYFTTLDYFSFKNTATSQKIDIQALLENPDLIDNISDIQIDKTASKYIDIQVKSDLSIFAQLHELSVSGDTPYAKFRIFSKNSNNEEYTYRYVKIYFLETTSYNLATTFVSNNESSNTSQSNNIYSSSPTIKRPDNYLYVTFKLKDSTIKFVDGNTIYVDRYFNGELVETQSYTTITDTTEAKFTLSQVGLHKFVVRDLAGRTQTFGTGTTTANALQIYLVNQILFEVNDASPINNQIFNSDVSIKIKSELAGLTLYNTRTLGITVTLNGQEIGVANSSEFTFSEPGSYSVTMVATTVLSDDTTTVADQEISTTYKFVIIKTNIATKSFNVSKGTGFEIDKIIKIVNNEREEVTEKFKNSATTENSGSLLWLTHENQGNSTFEITLKYYNQTLKDYQKFTFNVWINNDQPVIISSIPDGTSTKNAITLSFNPGIIYSQVGNCKILVNDKEYLVVDENSSRTVETITIAQKGTYWIKIVSEDGTLISSYKYTKNDPISKTTQIVLISVACGIVVLVVLFLLIRRKGKYR